MGDKVALPSGITGVVLDVNDDTGSCKVIVSNVGQSEQRFRFLWVSTNSLSIVRRANSGIYI